MRLYERGGKRLFDLVFSGLALAALSPVLPLCAAAIRLTSRGPAIFRQTRVGVLGEPFTLLKFRTMPVHSGDVSSADAAGLVITPIGRLLRRTNFDELPQLVNIVRGEMSVVGPRPALATQDDLLMNRTSKGAGRLRPGLTGLAQVNSYDGMTPRDKALWDEKYAQQVTLRQDINIILSTLRYLTKPPPRY